MTTATLTALTIIISVISLANDVTIIFQNLFYIPIVLACYFFLKRGLVFSVLLSLTYFFMLFFYSTDSIFLLGAFIRVLIFISVACIVTFLTLKRNEAESRLIESESFNKELVEEMPNLVIIYGQDLRIKYVNKLVFSSLGYTEDEIVGTKITDYMDIGQSGKIADFFKDCQTMKTLESVETKLIKKSGSRISVISRCVPMRFLNDPVALILFTDISDYKRAEESLKIANKKLQILSSITRHDINNCLTVMVGYSELLRERNIGPENTMLVDKIDESASLISEMIEFAKDYEYVGTESPKWQNWHEAFDEASMIFKEASIQISNELPKGLHVYSDTAIMKVFYNLIDNSVRHGSKLTLIQICALESEESMKIIYRDDGSGISKEFKTKIFDKGFGRNTGLGMFLVKELLSMTNIAIIENGIPGEGVRFELEIPIGRYRYCLN